MSAQTFKERVPKPRRRKWPGVHKPHHFSSALYSERLRLRRDSASRSLSVG